VLFNLGPVYHRVFDPIFEYHEPAPETMDMSPVNETHPPRIDYRTALAMAEKMMAEQAKTHGFVVESQTVFEYQDNACEYFYNVRSSRDIADRDHISFTTLTFNCNTGKLRSVHIPSGEYSGNTIALWLQYLHMVWTLGLPYRIFVFLLGILMAMLSATGVYIWWRKQRVLIQIKHRLKQAASPAAAAAGGRSR